MPMEPLVHLGRTLASLRSLGAMSVTAAAQRAGVSSEALRAAERGVLAPEIIPSLARLYGVEAESLLAGRIQFEPVTDDATTDDATIFLLHGAYQDFAPSDWAKLDRALQFGRLYASSNRQGLAERQGFIPVPAAGTKPRDAAMQGHALARRVRSRLNLGGAPLDDVRKLVEERLGIVVLVERFETDDLRAASIVDASRTAAAIVVSAMDASRQKAPLLSRVYLAHELCHILFDPSAPGRVQIVLDENPQTQPRGSSRAASRETLLESRAKGFAAEFLLPRAGVEPLLGPPEGDGLSISRARTLVEKAAEHFKTPWQLTTWHLKNLGYMAEPTAEELIRAQGSAPSLDPTSLPPVAGPPLSLSADEAAAVPHDPQEAPPGFVAASQRVGAEVAARWVDDILERAYAEVEADRPLAASDLLFEQVDAALSGDSERARLLLDRLDPARLAPDVLTPLLTLASHGRDVLAESWLRFLARTLQALDERWAFPEERRRRLLERIDA